MKQPVFLLSLTLSGVKNIDRDITLSFYKKTVDDSFDISDYRTKAVYGENGSGKTAIVIGVQILKDLILKQNYLNDAANQKYLHEIINKKINRLHLECEFYARFNSGFKVYNYSLIVKPNENGDFTLASETLYVRNANYATSKYHELYKVVEGELFYETDDMQELEILKQLTANLLINNTLFVTLINSKSFEQIKDTELVVHLANLYILGLDIVTSLDYPDMQSKTYARDSFRMVWDKSEEGVRKGIVKPKWDGFDGDSRLVRAEDFEDYIYEVEKLERFIKLFKRDLDKLEIDKKERYGLYECSLIMNYVDYRVHISYESTGIRKLVRLFDYMSFAMDGKIVFIDEMDSNINDVYLCKLIEFFKLYGNGQLCFTTHSTSPMEVLRDAKLSIDFLSSDSRIVPWKKNGNYTPERMYRRGMIEYLPFNIEAEDFLGILGD